MEAGRRKRRFDCSPLVRTYTVLYAIGNRFARAYFQPLEVDLRVESSLKSRHFTFDDVFNFVRQLRFHVLLQPTEKERTKDFVQTSNDQNSFFLVQLDLKLRRKFKNKIKPAKKVSTRSHA
jgi:hypothetical protein